MFKDLPLKLKHKPKPLLPVKTINVGIVLAELLRGDVVVSALDPDHTLSDTFEFPEDADDHGDQLDVANDVDLDVPVSERASE